jgi:tetratricopeptide (TPR) repeat protein
MHLVERSILMKNKSCKSMVISIIIIPILLSCASTQQKQSEPRDAQFYLNRGDAYGQKGQYDQAISDFNKALEINPRYAKAYNNRGIAYEMKGQYDQAISDYNKALKIDPETAETYYNRGNAHYKKGQYDRAISDFNKALEMNPRYAEAYINRGTVYSRKGQNDEAISDYSKAIEIDPEGVKAYHGRAEQYISKGQYDKTISDLEKALEINPKNADTNNNLAWVLATAKVSAFRDGKKAVELALKACELADWKNLGYLDTLAAAYARAGDFENAVKWQEKVIGSPEVPKQADLQAELQERLKFYKEHKPWPHD